MLATERQRIILEATHRDGQVLVGQLAAELNVSDETIRRDISYLNEVGAIRKVHGGAVPIAKNQFEDTYEIRVDIDREEKEKIGKYANQFINSNDVIAIDSGATLDWLALAINGVENLTIITCSISAIDILVKKQNSGDFSGRIIFLGGEVNCRSNAVEGGLTNEMLSRFSIDKAFIAATSISNNGVRMYHIEDGIFSSLLIKNSAMVFILSASHKFGKESLYKVCDLEAVHHIITDEKNKISEKLLRALDEAGVQLHVVSA